MSLRRERRFLGSLIISGRIAGIVMIAIAVLDFPATHRALGRYDTLVDLIGSITLAFLGIAWLVVLGWLIKFFDEFLSRN